LRSFIRGRRLLYGTPFADIQHGPAIGAFEFPCFLDRDVLFAFFTDNFERLAVFQVDFLDKMGQAHGIHDIVHARIQIEKKNIQIGLFGLVDDLEQASDKTGTDVFHLVKIDINRFHRFFLFQDLKHVIHEKFRVECLHIPFNTEHNLGIIVFHVLAADFRVKVQTVEFIEVR
jgi:hypothetical protein